MKPNEFMSEFPAYADAGISIELVSAPGRGKSTMVRQLVKTMTELTGKEWGYSDLFLATQTPPDLIGFQFKGEVTYEGKSFAITDPTAPTWFMTETGLPVFAYERGIMFLDEFGQGQTDVKAAAAELLLNKRLGKWKLPDGWIVVAASNRTSDRSGVTKSLDFVINRRMEIHLTDDLDAWMDWAEKEGLMPETRAFAYANPGIVFTDGVPEKQGPWCTPRSLAMLDKLLQAKAKHHGGEVPLDGLTLEAMSGLIGQAAASQFMATIRLAKDMPPLEDILRDPHGVPVPTRPDAQMLIAFHLAHRVDRKNASAIVTYIERLMSDLSLTFIRAACQRDPMIITTPALQKWCMDRAELMHLVSK
jgi:hypothetical protein